jgi:hypothetical protein
VGELDVMKNKTVDEWGLVGEGEGRKIKVVRGWEFGKAEAKRFVELVMQLIKEAEGMKKQKKPKGIKVVLRWEFTAAQLDRLAVEAGVAREALNKDVVIGILNQMLTEQLRKVL